MQFFSNTFKDNIAIRQEVAAIPPAMTRKAMGNFRERLQEFVINNGGTWVMLSLKVFEKNCSICAFYK